ncbi:hypothetical protein [Microvirga massiliensis]|uniref:hypothetical protein n=1 Tax=Microvirga massiliensis TaxID=1033741 RepID=UPI00062B5433|nr:hypothetical protein [Microvirga massiliensis]
MFGASTMLAGLASAAFVLASAAPAMVRHQVGSSEALPRGDRLAAPKIAAREPVASTEIRSLSGGQIILRARDGRLLYMSDPMTGITRVARGAEIPQIVLKPSGGPTTPPNDSEPANRTDPRRAPMPIGCERSISPLASPEAPRIARLCLASLATPAGS